MTRPTAIPEEAVKAALGGHPESWRETIEDAVRCAAPYLRTQGAEQERERLRDIIRSREVETELARMLVENKRQWREHGGKAKEDARDILAGLSSLISLLLATFDQEEK